MSVQGGNAIYHGFAYAGMLADTQLYNAVSKLNKGAVGTSIAFGKGVVTDSDYGAKLPTGTSTAPEFNGVVRYELNRAHSDTDTNGGATGGYDMTVVTHGVIWVTVLDTVAKDDPVYLRVGTTNTGDFSGIVGTGATLGVLLPGVKFLMDGVAGSLVKISLGLGG